MSETEDAIESLGAFWDSCNWWQKILVACILIVVCSLVAEVVVGHAK